MSQNRMLWFGDRHSIVQSTRNKIKHPSLLLFWDKIRLIGEWDGRKEHSIQQWDCETLRSRLSHGRWKGRIKREQAAVILRWDEYEGYGSDILQIPTTMRQAYLADAQTLESTEYSQPPNPSGYVIRGYTEMGWWLVECDHECILITRQSRDYYKVCLNGRDHLLFTTLT